VPKLRGGAIVPFVREGLCRKVGGKFQDKTKETGMALDGRWMAEFDWPSSGGILHVVRTATHEGYRKYFMGIAGDSWYGATTVGSGKSFTDQKTRSVPL
jgi:hypothetical protein